MTKRKEQTAPSEDRLAVGRHIGERIWGYEVMADGSIRLSPGFAGQLTAVLERENGLLEMQRGIAAYVADGLTITAKQRREWWDILQSDLGVQIDKGGGWTFVPRGGCVRPPDEKEAAGETASK